MSGDNLLRHARAHAAFDKTITHGEGKIVAYCDAPQYLIEREDGSYFWWRTDLTEVTSNPDSTRRNNE